MKKDFDYSKMAKVSIEKEGKIYEANYFVEKGILTVLSEYGNKSTQLGGLMAENLAKILLSELVNN